MHTDFSAYVAGCFCTPAIKSEPDGGWLVLVQLAPHGLLGGLVHLRGRNNKKIKKKKLK